MDVKGKSWLIVRGQRQWSPTAKIYWLNYRQLRTSIELMSQILRAKNWLPRRSHKPIHQFIVHNNQDDHPCQGEEQSCTIPCAWEENNPPPAMVVIRLPSRSPCMHACDGNTIPHPSRSPCMHAGVGNTIPHPSRSPCMHAYVGNTICWAWMFITFTMHACVFRQHHPAPITPCMHACVGNIIQHPSRSSCMNACVCRQHHSAPVTLTTHACMRVSATPFSTSHAYHPCVHACVGNTIQHQSRLPPMRACVCRQHHSASHAYHPCVHACVATPSRAQSSLPQPMSRAIIRLHCVHRFIEMDVNLGATKMCLDSWHVLSRMERSVMKYYRGMFCLPWNVLYRVECTVSRGMYCIAWNVLSWNVPYRVECSTSRTSTEISR